MANLFLHVWLGEQVQISDRATKKLLHFADLRDISQYAASPERIFFAMQIAGEVHTAEFMTTQVTHTTGNWKRGTMCSISIHRNDLGCGGPRRALKFVPYWTNKSEKLSRPCRVTRNQIPRFCSLGHPSPLYHMITLWRCGVRESPLQRAREAIFPH